MKTSSLRFVEKKKKKTKIIENILNLPCQKIFFKFTNFKNIFKFLKKLKKISNFRKKLLVFRSHLHYIESINGNVKIGLFFLLFTCVP